MNPIKPNTSIRVAIFNSFESRGKLTTAEEIEDIEAHVRDFLANKLNKTLLQTVLPSETARIAELIEAIMKKG